MSDVWLFPSNAIEATKSLVDHSSLLALADLAVGRVPSGPLAGRWFGPSPSRSEALRVLEWARVGYPRLRLTVDGVLIDPSEYFPKADGVWQSATNLRPVPDSLPRLLAGGALLVVDEIDQVIPELGAVCATFESLTGLEIWANLYLAEGTGGFAPHVDDHDVLAVGLEGAREWRVGGQELMLEPGGTLLIPSGLEHSVGRPLDDRASHLSISFQRPSLIDVIAELGSDGPAPPRTLELRFGDLARCYWSGRTVGDVPDVGEMGKGPLLCANDVSDNPNPMVWVQGTQIEIPASLPYVPLPDR